MDQQGATALTDDELLERLSDLLMAKLARRENGNCLLSSGSRVRVAPGTPLKLISEVFSHARSSA